MTPADLAELWEIFRALVDDVESESFPEITVASLAAREETA